MRKILGLDLGTNSIGWAIVDKDTQKIDNCGTRFFSTQSTIFRAAARQNRRTKERLLSKEFVYYNGSKSINRATLIEAILIFFTAFTGALSVLNRGNWQFWLNLSLTLLVTLLAVLHQDKK